MEATRNEQVKESDSRRETDERVRESSAVRGTVLCAAFSRTCCLDSVSRFASGGSIRDFGVPVTILPCVTYQR
ncbi:hypothetical protein WN55_03119 [Dufourea novaeangliae]|uniref:Uncharacterized protein n=1 Tax=Dufourea novaeangliae TaxID=178035 RepID=A0A154PJJ8_DUFNO|nr:hypothetical protein WN55_03119 [Dufourea novaeangliae]